MIAGLGHQPDVTKRCTGGVSTFTGNCDTWNSNGKGTPALNTVAPPSRLGPQKKWEVGRSCGKLGEVGGSQGKLKEVGGGLGC